MKALYLDCFAGISGNMFLGAMLQLGVPEAYLKKELEKLPLADEFALEVRDLERKGIQSLYVEVKLHP